MGHLKCVCDFVVRAGCGKPAFFNSRKPMFEVHTSSGMLRNTDSGNPMVPIGQPPAPCGCLFPSCLPPMLHKCQANAQAMCSSYRRTGKCCCCKSRLLKFLD